MSKATFDPTRYNNSNNTPFETVLERHIERRSLIRSGGAMAALSVMAGFGLSGCNLDIDAQIRPIRQALFRRVHNGCCFERSFT